MISLKEISIRIYRYLYFMQNVQVKFKFWGRLGTFGIPYMHTFSLLYVGLLEIHPWIYYTQTCTTFLHSVEKNLRRYGRKMSLIMYLYNIVRLIKILVPSSVWTVDLTQENACVKACVCFEWMTISHLVQSTVFICMSNINSLNKKNI